MIKKFLLLSIVFIFFSNVILANPDANDSLMNSSKFFVVISVLTTILAGIFILLVYLERKISKLENQSTHK
jgi:heme/copper-type cytochrome/quinol oxidase subunit 2